MISSCLKRNFNVNMLNKVSFQLRSKQKQKEKRSLMKKTFCEKTILNSGCVSRSVHPTPKFTNPEFSFIHFLSIFPDKIFNNK